MSTLVELSSSKHQTLKVAKNCGVRVAASQHIVNLRVGELAKAVSSLPVFFTKNPHNGQWMITAVTSFTEKENLFVDNDTWQANYIPANMQTYPLHLMQKEGDEKNYTIGIDEDNPDLTHENGQALFEEDGKPTLYLSQIKALLEADIKDSIQTFQFTQALEKLNLLKSINIVVQHQDDSVQTIKGLSVIDEDKLNSLSGEVLSELNQKGYLSPIHAQLISIFQLNALIKRNNSRSEKMAIKSIKLALEKTNNL